MRQVAVPPPPLKFQRKVEASKAAVDGTSSQLDQQEQQHQQPSSDEVHPPQHVYIADVAEAWVPAVVLERLSKTEFSCRLEETDEVRSVQLKDYPGCTELPRQNSVVATPDLVDIEHLHEAAILYTLRHRHASCQPYTRSGDLILAVNPFQWLGHLYTLDTQRLYAQQLVWQIATTDPRLGLEPHLYEVSALSYAELAFEGLSQSILITGESGSGKTEATKLLMHHIASIQQGSTTTTTASSSTVSSRTLQFQPHGGIDSMPMRTGRTKAKNNETVDRILQANPLLEAFGNAATVRNDNSSRFGKYTQLQLDLGDPQLRKFQVRSPAMGVLVGSHCHVYLLETSRVCWHASNERTYHIFYQLLAAPDEVKASIWCGLNGRLPADFRYVGTPPMHAIEGVRDGDKFTEVCTALQRVGVSESSTTQLMRAICMVLQLGNIAFDADPTADDRVIVRSEVELDALSKLMGIATDELLLPFTVRSMTTRGETFQVRLSHSAANEACDALAKELYLRTFSWLVRAINDRTCAETNQRHDAATNGPLGVIGILDIFGFESFVTNGFGQLCINYANERLHQHAMNDIFRDTKAEYDFQGIPLFAVEVEDNEGVLNLIESRSGLIALLNEECYRPKGNDLAFVSKVLDHLKESKYVIKPKRGVTNQFGVAHYAGVVMYTAHNFVESNQDTLPNDLRECANKCNNVIVVEDHLRNDKANKAVAPVVIGGSDESSNGSPVTTEKECQIHNHPPSQASTARSMFSKPQNMKEESPFSSSGAARHKKDVCCDHKTDIPANKTNSGVNRCKSMPVSTTKPTNTKSLKRQSSSDLVAATVWSKYQDDLSSLMKKLGGSHCRYVRCIKPNPAKQPLICDRKSTTEQLRCAGIVSTVKLARAVYPNSLPNKLLAGRYVSMWDKQKFPTKAKRMDNKERRHALECESILLCALQPLMVENDHSRVIPFAVGKTKTYFRKGVMEWLEAQRVFELDRVATVIQKRARGNTTRHIQLQRASATSILQRWFRAIQTDRTIRRARAATVLQKRLRGSQARRSMVQRCRSIRAIQQWYRMAAKRKAMAYCTLGGAATLIQIWYRSVSQDRRHERTCSARLLQAWYRHTFLDQRHARQNDASRVVQAWYRQHNTSGRRHFRHAAARTIQRTWRGRWLRRHWRQIRISVSLLQRWYRATTSNRAVVIPMTKRKRFLEARNVFERSKTKPPFPVDFRT